MPHGGPAGALLLLAAYHARVNDGGQTPLAAAAFRQSAESVTILLQVGADPDHGNPSAAATAEFFDLPEMVALLSERPAPG